MIKYNRERGREREVKRDREREVKRNRDRDREREKDQDVWRKVLRKRYCRCFKIYNTVRKRKSFMTN